MISENIIVAAVIIALSLIVCAAPAVYGAVKKRNVIKPAEYFPPRGLSPLDFLIQYYGSRANPREIFNPLMLYWAERGFITIEEDCKRGLKLTKLKDLTCPERGPAETFKLEKQLFDCLFFGKSTVFYTLAALNTFREDYEKIMSSCKKLANRVTAERSAKFSVLSIAATAAMLFAVVLVTALSLEDGKIMLMSVFPIVAVFALKFSITATETGSGIPKGSAAYFLLFPFFAVFGGIPLTVLVVNVPLAAAILISAATLTAIINLFILSPLTDIRTDGQLKAYAQICGFKRFLVLAEASQLEALVEEDPRYYYDILPYCYILKITEKMKPKFDAIALDGPAWYLGELRDTLMF